MKAAVLTVVLLCSYLAAAALAQQAPEQRPPPPVNSPVTAASLFKDAQALAASQQPDQAIRTWQQGLALAPADGQARLQLGNLLVQERRAAEAIAVLRPALQISTELPLFQALLAALRTAGSPIDFAMSAEEALVSHPDNPGLLGTAAEALLAVRAIDRAWGYWQRLPQTEQNTAWSQWLLGSILEAQAKPALAWAAYTRSAPSEPRAKTALQRMSSQSVLLAGWRYFAPPNWVVSPGEAASLRHVSNGAHTRIVLHQKSTLNQAAQAAVLQRLPLPPSDIAALLTQPKADPQALMQLERLPCPNPDTGLCAYVGPAPAFVGLLPEIYFAVLTLGVDAVTVSIDNAERNIALQALASLTHKMLIAPGSAP